MVNLKVIVEHFEATIGDHPKIKVREIERRVALEMYVNVNMKRCRRAKKMVKDKLAVNFIHEFAKLWDDAGELRLKNLGSTIKMAMNRVTPKSPPHFKRVSYWLLFVEMETIRCTKLPGLLLRGKALDLQIAINDILPRVELKNYARHVLSNWPGRKKAKTFEFAFWKVMKSTTEREWEQNKEDLFKLDEGVAKELLSKNSKAWTKAFQGLHSVSDIVDNNLCEAFNFSNMESRFKSIITMLEEIRFNMMIRIMTKRKQCSSWKYNYGPVIKKKFDDSKKEGVD
ncbi:hypothetical protein Goklo_004629 [Gossypium klotzschianum]|uniref:Uncharacterized protein n=1 Tax=Gossypium klotzschianum TaxID=34286 RepID=A0A7J8VPC5_9ROSI|nr:hypothetical protein [Gossypium klotzschianum]